MAYRDSSIRLPDIYWDYLDSLAKVHGSRGYVIQELLYKEGAPKLPPPEKRDPFRAKKRATKKD